MADDRDRFKSPLQRDAEFWTMMLKSRVKAPEPLSKAALTYLLRERLAMECEETGLTWAQMVTDSVIARAIQSGDAREIFDRIEGRVPQAVAHTGADGGELSITHRISAVPMTIEEWQERYERDRPANNLVSPARTTNRIS